MVIRPTLERNDDVLHIPNLETWTELYLKDCVLSLHKQTTIEHYKSAFKRFSIWYATRLTDGAITKRNAVDFAYWLKNIKRPYDDHPGRPTHDASLSPATIRRTVGVIRTFFTWLYEEDYLPRDFACWFPFPRLKPSPPKVVSIETLAALLAGASQGDMPARDISLIALIADTGIRRTEAATLTIEQIGWLGDDNRGCLNNVLGKGDRWRTVPFSATVGTLLRYWLEERKRLLQVYQNNNLLFLTRDGKPIVPDSIYQILERCARRSGVENEIWNTHSLRHNFATHFWRIQRDTKSLSVILGHSSQKITEDIYVHAVPEDLIAAHTSVFTTGDVEVPTKLHAAQIGPTADALRNAILKTPNWTLLGQQFNLSNVAVRNWAVRHNLLDTYHAAKAKIRSA